MATDADRGPLRLCIVVHGLAGLSGGAERVLADLANGLARRGHAVEVVTHETDPGPPFYPLDLEVALVRLMPPPARRGALRRGLIDRGLRLFDRWIYRFGLHAIPPLGRLAWINRFGGFWRRLERHLDRTAPDVAIAFMPTAMTALALAKPRRAPGRIASTHNHPEFNFTGRVGNNVNPSYLALSRASLAQFDRITVLLHEHRAWHEAELRDKIVVMPNAIPPAPIRLRSGSRERLVLAVGRLAEVKRHTLLLEAWARLTPHLHDWRLEIYGAGPLRARLQSDIDRLGIGGSARLMGVATEIGSVYARAAMLAHPSAVEGFPMAVGEALAWGVPVIGFADCPGLDALVTDGVNGRLIAPGPDRVADFAAALSTLIADQELRSELGAAGPASIAPYAPDRILDRWEALIREVRSERREI